MFKSILAYFVATGLSSLTALSFGYDPLMVLMAAITAGFTVVHLPEVHWFKGIMTVLVITMLAINLAPPVTTRVFDSDSVLTMRSIAIIIALFSQAIITLLWSQIPTLNIVKVLEDALRSKLNARNKGGKS